MKRYIAACMTLLSAMPIAYSAQNETELERLREEVRLLKQARESFEKRIVELEQKLDSKTTPTAVPSAPQAARASDANPAISLILSGTYADLKRDPQSYRIGGFMPGAEVEGPPKRGFSLAESELVMSANIDPYFRGKFVAALTPENEVEIEEAYVESLAFGSGITGRAGRFFSGVGYLNSQHPHAWDFVDAPLAYQAFFGGNLKDDGLGIRWLAPTELFLELGFEALRGTGFPSSERDRGGFGTRAAYAHIGGDIGASHSWRAGASLVDARPRDRSYEDVDSLDRDVKNSFSGRSRTVIVDGVWKWAPQGDARKTNFKLQGEYFRRQERGSLVHDTEAAGAGPLAGAYAARQSGYYVQGVYQFRPRWRVGARYDRLSSGSVSNALIEDGTLTDADLSMLSAYNPRRTSLMLDYSPSEFSRWRLQLARDRARPDVADTQIFLQYIMSLGAHGAHSF